MMLGILPFRLIQRLIISSPVASWRWSEQERIGKQDLFSTPESPGVLSGLKGSLTPFSVKAWKGE
jgi:hypothetical protein